MGLKGIGRAGVNWIETALDGCTWQDVIHTLIKLQVPRNSENCLKRRRSCQHFEKDFVVWNMLCACACVCVCGVCVWCVCVRAHEGTISCIFNCLSLLLWKLKVHYIFVTLLSSEPAQSSLRAHV